MSDATKQEVSIESDSSSESSSEDESAPVESIHRYYYDKVVAESLAENMYVLSVESDLDDDEDDSSQSTSCNSPPQPFELEDYSEDDSDNSENEDNIPVRVHRRGLFPNSPQWYAYFRRFLSERQIEDLWNVTDWVDKWYWDDSTETEPPERPFFTDSFGLF
ncbi:uncharacterized protein LOC126780420 [Nymphalis io]|uniref:uncharacterized protein LOC126780420 n=1 Tax=Inachis io TaxID=171585 RepID=UPI0021678D6B|nr:uncharacterized protein LOC126780420 [Nymphalis io]XP_050360857.1 uncharacterized protein LOC126780420 [Nymphalis io]XP_050360858.1 uncharacterized protein LOC126780420 [Nymphalis io]